MERERLPYSKPEVRQLQYMADPHVSLAAGCKTQGSAQGATTNNCKTQRNAPCVATTS